MGSRCTTSSTTASMSRCGPTRSSDKNNLPPLPVPQLMVQALSKNIVPNPAGGFMFEGNPTSIARNNASQPSQSITVVSNGTWTPVHSQPQK